MGTPTSDNEREGTFTLPLTPAMRQFVALRSARTHTRALVTLLAALLALPLCFLIGYGEIGVLVCIGAVLYGCYTEFVVRRDARENLRVGTFSRYVGRLVVKEMPVYDEDEDADLLTGRAITGYRYELHVPACTFAVSEIVGRTLRADPWGRVDYLDVSGIGAPGGLLLEVRDRAGVCLYRHPEYEFDVESVSTDPLRRTTEGE